MAKVIEYVTTARKAVVALVGAALVVFGPDNAIVQNVIAVVTALGVYTVPNSTDAA